MIVNAGYRGKVGAAVPKFTYTGEYNTRKDGVVELITSGTLTFLSPAVIDRFMVGGGGCGGRFYGAGNPQCGGGGGGGYTKTDKKINVDTTPIAITIGEGGTAHYGDHNILDGKATSWGSDSVKGGVGVGTQQGTNPTPYSSGGAGGCGGGGGVISNSDGGVGGSNGGNGEAGTYPGGNGQGTTTREFGEVNGKLYAGGGGGGRYMVSSTPIISIGGAGGGGSGGFANRDNSVIQNPAAGVANTGGGGGGGAGWDTYSPNDGVFGATGGSGIVCFRAAK